MIPWENLASEKTKDGSVISLHRRGSEYVIRLDGRELMGNRRHASEEVLAQEGCAPILGRKNARVLIGGLGMGFTLRAALDVLKPDAKVDVAELSPAVVDWNKTWLKDFAKEPLEDERAKVLLGDVVEFIHKSNARYDAILLDVDNGPAAMTSPGNARLYSERGLGLIAHALKPEGVLAVWAASDAPYFTDRLKRARFTSRKILAPSHGGKGTMHVLWIATRSNVE